MPDLAYLNGKIAPIDEMMVPIEDRGYQFGDAVYEYIASYAGRLFRPGAHLERLRRSMTQLDYPALDLTWFRKELEAFYAKARIDRAGIYIQISRGVGPRRHEYDADSALQIVITIRALAPLSENDQPKAATAITVTDTRWGHCDIKTVQLLPNVMAKQQALNAGATDAIFVSDAGIVREGTSSNVFIVTNDRLLTHPLTQRILPGVTRAAIIDVCDAQGIAVEERRVTRDEMMTADEVFLTGTVTEVLPMIAVDGQAIGKGVVGPYAKRLFRGLRQSAGV